MRFGKVDNFIIFGGGQILLESCVLLKKRKKKGFRYFIKKTDQRKNI